MSGSKSSVPGAAAPSPEQADAPLSFTVHSQPQPGAMAGAANAQQRAGRLRMLLVVAVCAAPVLASYFTFYVLQPRGKAYGELITPTVDLPPSLSLQDLRGQPVPAESLKGQWLLTLVQDAHCDSACERLLFMQRQLREMMGKERDKIDKLWLVPDDQPLRPEVLAAVSAGVPVTVLRAPRAQIQAWLKPAEGHGLNEHLFLIDPMGRWMMRSPVQPDPSKVKKDLDRLIKANAGWDKPGR
ncbi:hypothetical protein PFX98_13425 [Paucibacter sediminis]|uniref:Cytochrome C oxidase subunit I n=1 Tax=Paucibacter sediminis TaxID=3019553 RepID=A0AA95SNN9_9BURK|nr:hypothetical protein [Paucibacter sp. S2-9]WIT09936.1 hypothetical protein PFX98_13425 [Paucibacter sp. S2-9]